jgi:hypothetical protein
MKKFLLILLFAFLIGIPAILPFFHAGYFPTHDGEWAVVRLGDMFRTLRDLQIPARYSGNLDFGYGYPLFNFTYPFPYYLGVAIHFLGFGFVNIVKILFAGSVILSVLFMFLAARLLWKNTWAGIVSSTLYVYFPYRMVDLYVRGSIGESLSFVLFPLLFYFAVKLVRKPALWLVALIAISIGILITTHNIMTVLFMPLFTVFILIQSILENKKAIKHFLISIVLGFGTSAFFWVPAIFEKKDILLSLIPIADRSLYFINFNQLLFSKWGYGIPTGPDSFTYQIGLAHICVLVAVLLVLLFIFVKNKKYSNDYFTKIALLLTAIITIYGFLLFESSKIFWEKLPLLSEINYPWIVLGILGFLISLLVGFLSRQTLGKSLMIILGTLALIIVLPNAKPQYYINNPDSYYLTNQATTTSSNELTPLWVKIMPLQRAGSKVEVISGVASVENVFFNSKLINFSVNAKSEVKIKINTIYYPGWKAYVDKINTDISYNNQQGVMEISVPSGSHVVQVKFEETPLRLAGDLISLFSVFIAVLLVIKRK